MRRGGLVEDRDGDPTAAELVELLLRERTFLKDVILHDGTAAILSALHSDDINVQLPLLVLVIGVWTPATNTTPIGSKEVASYRMAI